MTTTEVFSIIQRHFNKKYLGICSLGRTAEICYGKLPHSQVLFIDCMGCITDVAVGVALGCPNNKVLAFDTDGSFLFNLGTIHTLAEMKQQLGNLKILIFDNQILESGGGGQSRSAPLDWTMLFASWGLEVTEIDVAENFEQHFKATLAENQLSIIILYIDNNLQINNCTKDIDGIESRYMFKRTISNHKGGIIHPCIKN